MSRANDRPAWHRDTICASVPASTGVFYPQVGANVAPIQEVCRACGYREACARQALTENALTFRGGVWGGLTDRMRRLLRRDGEFTTRHGDAWLYDADTGEVCVIDNEAHPALSPIEAIKLLTELRDARTARLADNADEDASTQRDVADFALAV